jgi:hypothetical protein
MTPYEKEMLKREFRTAVRVQRGLEPVVEHMKGTDRSDMNTQATVPTTYNSSDTLSLFQKTQLNLFLAAVLIEKRGWRQSHELNDGRGVTTLEALYNTIPLNATSEDMHATYMAKRRLREIIYQMERHQNISIWSDRPGRTAKDVIEILSSAGNTLDRLWIVFGLKKVA